MAATGDDRVESATFFTTQVDFTHAGDLKVFVDEEQLTALEEGMQQRGYLEGSRMANAFNMLRPNDLIWPYVVNNYLKGQAPLPFDLLYWNSNSTRMPAANHAFYLRNCYLENKLTKGEMVLDNVRLDLKKVKIPIFNLAAKRGPHRACALGLRRLEGLRRAGRLRHGGLRPHRRRRQPEPASRNTSSGPAARRRASSRTGSRRRSEHPGSWWPYWFAWVEKQAPERVPAREPGGGKLEPLCDAPGEYVKAKA